ncbi:MAG: HNH endonuclease [Caldilineaceae bacterium]|nr:HNH endonuclease [Caldilineaceae bacterium]
MSQTYIAQLLRALVRERANYRCEYCLVHEDDGLLPHECDHIIAEQHGGKTEAENLAFACIHCNRKKGPNLASIDPETGQVVTLFNPRIHSWSKHFRIQEATIVPLTATGRATTNLLGLNAADRLLSRENLVQIGRYPYRDNA